MTPLILLDESELPPPRTHAHMWAHSLYRKSGSIGKADMRPSNQKELRSMSSTDRQEIESTNYSLIVLNNLRSAIHNREG